MPARRLPIHPPHPVLPTRDGQQHAGHRADLRASLRRGALQLRGPGAQPKGGQLVLPGARQRPLPLRRVPHAEAVEVLRERLERPPAGQLRLELHQQLEVLLRQAARTRSGAAGRVLRAARGAPSGRLAQGALQLRWDGARSRRAPLHAAPGQLRRARQDFPQLRQQLRRAGVPAVPGRVPPRAGRRRRAARQGVDAQQPHQVAQHRALLGLQLVCPHLVRAVEAH
mmetsp:Transcript_16248/g.41519  ORF Transcript_16248/g.41519 Transcript_16248/m.41519 type:complete len:226 (+) Transcript_16248:132-809(+)